MKLKRSNRGFTLVEIMIVVAIIGLLAAIAIPNFVRYRARARRAACVSNRVAIARAAENYMMEFDMTAKELVDYATDVPLLLAPADGSGYLKEMPACAADGVYTFGYSIAGSGGVFLVVCDYAGHPPNVSSAGEF